MRAPDPDRHGGDRDPFLHQRLPQGMGRIGFAVAAVRPR
jgi:hypothetical protein